MISSGNFDEDVTALFAKLESEDAVIARLSAVGSSSWPSVKNYLYGCVVKAGDSHKSKLQPLDYFRALALIALSLLNWIYNAMAKRSAPLYVGAGSGVIEHEAVWIDSHLPSAIESGLGIPAPKIHYWLSAASPSNLWAARAFLWNHHVVVYSVLVAPIRALAAVVIGLWCRRNHRLRSTSTLIAQAMADIGVACSAERILQTHARFFAGTLAFRFLLAPVRITQAFIVSSYSNASLCAALRARHIHISEVQHGLIGPTHRGYNYAVRDILLPAPDTVYVYNDFWREELESAGYFEPDQIIPTERTKYRLSADSAPPINEPYCVFTGQGVMSDSVAEFLISYNQYLAAKTLLYLPHPTESPQKLAQLDSQVGRHGRVKIWPVGKYLTESAIMHSCAHISIYSSCHFDAFHFLGRTFVLDVLPGNPINYYIRRRPMNFISVKDANSFIKMSCPAI